MYLEMLNQTAGARRGFIVRTMGLRGLVLITCENIGSVNQVW